MMLCKRKSSEPLIILTIINEFSSFFVLLIKCFNQFDVMQIDHPPPMSLKLTVLPTPYIWTDRHSAYVTTELCN